VFIARDTDLTVRMQTAARAPFVSLFQVFLLEEGNVGAKGSWKRSQQKRTKTLGQPAGTDRKSTSGTCHLLGSSLISCHSKKQACVALSTTEAEYIAAGSCCMQILWIKQQLQDFGLKISKVPLLCDNTSAINLTKDHVQHSRTKHIEIRHHFICDHITNGDCEVKFVSTKRQLANILVMSSFDLSI